MAGDASQRLGYTLGGYGLARVKHVFVVSITELRAIAVSASVARALVFMRHVFGGPLTWTMCFICCCCCCCCQVDRGLRDDEAYGTADPYSSFYGTSSSSSGRYYNGGYSSGYYAGAGGRRTAEADNGWSDHFWHKPGSGNGREYPSGAAPGGYGSHARGGAAGGARAGAGRAAGGRAGQQQQQQRSYYHGGSSRPGGGQKWHDADYEDWATDSDDEDGDAYYWSKF